MFLFRIKKNGFLRQFYIVQAQSDKCPDPPFSASWMFSYQHSPLYLVSHMHIYRRLSNDINIKYPYVIKE